MAIAVGRAITERRPLIVQAGTGTGKTLGYLVPIAVAGIRAVIVTATRALQDQLSGKDLPFLAEQFGPGRLDYAVLKGRSNYLCHQRLDEVRRDGAEALDLGDGRAPVSRDEIERLATWAADSPTGDRSELTWSPDDRTWRAVSVGSDECPGASRCPRGADCFAERARSTAAAATIVVVNTHLYGQHVRSGGALLPPHDLVVFDEAHVLEDIMSSTVGVEIGGGRFATLAAAVARIIVDPQLIAQISDIASMVATTLGERVGERLGPPLPAEVADLVVEARSRLGRVQEALLGIETTDDDARQRLLRAQVLLGRLADDLDLALTAGTGTVAFATGRPEAPRLEIAPLDVGPTLRQTVWDETTSVLTSATIPSNLVERLGLPAGRFEAIDVGSPFDYEHQALLYCAMDLPDPRHADYRRACHEELAELIAAARGRTLALFTSWSALDEAATALRERIGYRLITQRELPQGLAVREFLDDESSCLFATAGFFQGIDVPGPALSLVVIDRLPFPRPDDPLLSARREALGPAAFGQIDLPRAATMLAQAAGRLIRTADDRGVVAVLDRRLGTARYRWDIIRALPPMRRTRHRSDAIDFLRSLPD